MAESLRPTLLYVNWLSLLYNGLAKALEMYSTETGKFMQVGGAAGSGHAPLLPPRCDAPPWQAV